MSRVFLSAVLVSLSACSTPESSQVCEATLEVRLSEPNPFRGEKVADMANIVISRAGAPVFDESIELFGVGSGGLRVDVVDSSGNRPMIPPSPDLQLSLSAYSSFDDGNVAILAFGRTGRFACPPDTQVSVPLYVGEPNRFAEISTSSMARADATATRIDDSRVLIVGGQSGGSGAEPPVLIYDHAQGELCGSSDGCLGNEIPARVGHTATPIHDTEGKVRAVLVVGGRDPETASVLDEVWRFDVTAGTFSQLSVDASTLARSGHAAIEMRGSNASALDGKVLVIGGCGVDCGPGNLRADLIAIDPDSGTADTIELTGMTPFYDATATMLPNGMVLIAGGRDEVGDALHDVQLLDGDKRWHNVEGPCTGGSTSLCSARYGHTATVLDDDNVLLLGGESADEVAASPVAEVYLLGSNRVVPVDVGGSSFPARIDHTTTRVSCDQPPCPLLVVGGRNPAQRELAVAPGLFRTGVNATDVNTYRATFEAASMTQNPRAQHVAAALADGTVFTAGGVSPQDDSPRAHAAIFSSCEAAESELTCPEL